EGRYKDVVRGDCTETEMFYVRLVGKNSDVKLRFKGIEVVAESSPEEAAASSWQHSTLAAARYDAGSTTTSVVEAPAPSGWQAAPAIAMADVGPAANGHTWHGGQHDWHSARLSLDNSPI